jgi:hypothetical protein
MPTTLVLYATHEIELPLKYFISKGIYPDIEYVFVVNNKSLEGKVEELLPSWSNSKVLYRENEGYDFAAWDYALKNVDVSKYNYFIFLNSSVIGPILPDYFTEKWTDIFINFLSKDTILTGSTINLQVSRHVQSYILCTNKDGLRIIRPYIKSYHYKTTTIRKGEIGLSKGVTDKGYKIFSLLREETDINPTITQYDPTDVIFIKTVIAFKRGLLNQLDMTSKCKIQPKPEPKSHSNATNVKVFYIFNNISFNLIYFLACNRNLSNSIYLVTSIMMPRKNILGYEIIYSSDPIDFVFSDRSNRIIIKDHTIGPILPRWLRLKYNWLTILTKYLEQYFEQEKESDICFDVIFDGNFMYCKDNLYESLCNIKNIDSLKIFSDTIESLRKL